MQFVCVNAVKVEKRWNLYTPTQINSFNVRDQLKVLMK